MLFKRMRLTGWAVLLLLLITSCSIVNANDCGYDAKIWDNLDPSLQDVVKSHTPGSNYTLQVSKDSRVKIDICSKNSGVKRLAFSLDTRGKDGRKASFEYGECKFEAVFQSKSFFITSEKNTDGSITNGYVTIVLEKSKATMSNDKGKRESIDGFCNSGSWGTTNSFSASVSGEWSKPLELNFDDTDYELPASPPTTTTPAPTTKSSATPTSDEMKNSSAERSKPESTDVWKSGLSPMWIAFLVLGILAIVALLGVGGFFLFRHYRNKRDKNLKKRPKKTIITSTAIPIEEDGDMETALRRSNASEKSSKRTRNEQAENPDETQEPERKPVKDAVPKGQQQPPVPIPQANVPEPKKDGAYDDYEPVGRIDLTVPPPPLPGQ